MNKDITETLHFQEVNGINLHYVTWGTFTRPERAVVLVHGLTANHQEWAQLGPALAEEGWFTIATPTEVRGNSKPTLFGKGRSKLSPFLMVGSEAMHKHHSTLGPGERTPGNIMQINAIDFLEVESFGDVLVHQ